MTRSGTTGALAAVAIVGLLAGCSAQQRADSQRTAGAAVAQGQRAANAVVDDVTAIQPSELQVIVDKARTTVQEAGRDPAFGASPQLLREARAVVIIPDAIKAALVLGGQGGQGVMLTRNQTGWSYPAFVTYSVASAGPQIGVESADVVIFALSERALQGLLQNEVKIGAQAGLTAITLGSNTKLATTPKLDADIIVWAKSQGAYAGLTVEGAVVAVREAANQAYYGRPVTTADILRGGVSNPAADPLRRALPAR
jgi:lipid-binding SYLF domain-containing protein